MFISEEFCVKKVLCLALMAGWIFVSLGQTEVVQIDRGEKETKQTFKQVVKGRVIDDQDNSPLVGVYVYFKDEPSKGVSSDSLGCFRLEHATGRHTLNIALLGYEKQELPLFLNTIQECWLEITIEPDAQALSEASVTAAFQKERPLHPLVYGSGRSFSTEEAYRYAGSLGDPARMARNYAGVIPPDDSRNDIIIRGNSPTGLLWRVDGIEIANPNHFGSMGLTGSTVTLLNTNMMSNSDFLTGAFPAEYGNALSGVFDLRMKKAPTDRYQFRFGTSWNGFELGAEGPFSKTKSIGTFQVCYRYSFMDVMSKLGLNVGVNPKYQDLTAKMEFNLNSRLTLSVLSLWGTSFIELGSTSSSANAQHLCTGSGMLLGGVTLMYQPNEKTHLSLTASASDNDMLSDVDRLTPLHTAVTTSPIAIGNLRTTHMDRSNEKKYSLSANLKTRPGKRNYLTAGVQYDLFDMDFFQKNAQRIQWISRTRGNSSSLPEKAHHTILKIDTGLAVNTSMALYRAYIQEEYRFNDCWKATVGLHGQYLNLNSHYAIEPRAGIQFRPSAKHRFGLAYGSHHQTQIHNLYFYQNEQLNFSAAQHYTLSHDWQIGSHLRLKTDCYYQFLSQIAVENDEQSSFSMLNIGSDFYVPLRNNLVNKGKGENYGLEITLEKFMSEHFYYMVNATAFRSKYTGGDGRWYNSCYDMRYLLNGLFGYEYWLNENMALCADVKMTYTGGKPYTPVNEALSMALGEVVYDTEQTYTKRYPAYFRPDVKFSLKINYKKLYYDVGLDFQNCINRKNVLYSVFEPSSGKYDVYYQTLFYPMVTFKLLF